MSYTVIIPARMHSTRLPEKPLRLIAGIPMVVRVAQAAARTEASRVVVATDLELGRGRGISNLDKKARITRPAPLI